MFTLPLDMGDDGLRLEFPLMFEKLTAALVRLHQHVFLRLAQPMRKLWLETYR